MVSLTERLREEAEKERARRKKAAPSQNAQRPAASAASSSKAADTGSSRSLTERLRSEAEKERKNTRSFDTDPLGSGRRKISSGWNAAWNTGSSNTAQNATGSTQQAYTSAADIKARHEAIEREIDALQKSRAGEIGRYVAMYGIGATNLKDYQDYMDKLKALEKERDSLAGSYYMLENEGNLNAVEKDTGLSARYERAKELQSDMDKISSLVSYANSNANYPEEIAALKPYLSGKYGLDENELESFNLSGTALYKRLKEELDKETEALAAAGYDFERMSGYQQMQNDADRYKKEQQETQKFASEHPFLSSASTVLVSPLQGLDYAAAILGNAGHNNTSDPDTYEPVNVYNMVSTNYVSTVRDTVSKELEDNTDWELFGRNVAAFLYNSGMSIADSAAQVATMGPFSIVAMGGSAAASQAKSVIERGGTNQQAFLGGLAAGIAEMMFEKVSVEQLLTPQNVTGIKSWLKETAKQMGTEASEEMFTEVSNIFSDAAIMSEKSDFAINVQNYKSQGMSEEEAKKQAFLDCIGQVVEAGVGGALSGGVMGGVRRGFDAAANYYDVAKTGAEFRTMGDDVVQAVIQEGLESGPSTQSYKLAQQLQRKRDAGQTITNAEIGRLYQANVEAVNAEERAQESTEQQADELTTQAEGTAYTLEDAARDAVAAQQEHTAHDIVAGELAQDIMAPRLTETLEGGKRLDPSILTQEQIDEWNSRDDIWLDASGKVYQVDPQQHISQRTYQSVGDRSVNAFQYDHPQLQQYYRPVAEELIRIASVSQDAPKTGHWERTVQGKKYVESIFTTPELRGAMDMGLSRNDIIKAAQALIDDKGQENYAAAKRLELILDSMLTNGYTTAGGESVGPNSSYIEAKQGILGYQEAEHEGLPIYDMEKTLAQTAFAGPLAASDATMSEAIEEASERAVQAAYDAGAHNVPRNLLTLETSAQVDAYEQGRRDAILAQKSPGTTVEKPAFEAYTDSETEGSAGTVPERMERVKKLQQKYGISDREAAAILNYKSSGSYKLNVALRDGTLNQEQRQETEALDSALEKLPRHEGTVYRRLSFDMEGREAFEAFLEEHEAGAYLQYPAYTSTSTSPEGYPVEGDLTVTLVMESATGRDMAGFGNNFESEIVFPRDSAFYIERVKTDEQGPPVIYMREVTDYGIRQLHSQEQHGRMQQVPEVQAGDGHLREVPRVDSTAEAGGALPGLRAEGGKRQGVRGEVNPQRQIADEVLKYIESGKDFSASRLFQIADRAYGGTMAEGAYTVKDAYDGMELAVNLYLMNAGFVKQGNGNAAAANKTLNKLIEMLKHIPTQTKRTAEQESYQQFSTPPNIAFLAAWCANVDAGDVVLEPSAGTGGLALWPKAWGAVVYANELSGRRLAFLNELGLDGIFNLNAEQIDNLLPDNVKPSVVVMNPPFSATAGRTNKNNTANAKRHIEQALDRLEDGGRLVAILGNGMADSAPAFRSWWDELRKEYNVRANIRIDGQNYRKYGTTFDVQLVVIDKTGPNTVETKTGIFKNLTDVPAFMEEIRNDRTRVSETDSNVNRRVSGVSMGRGLDSGVRQQDATGNRARKGLDGQGTAGRAVNESGDAGEIRGRVRDGRSSESRVESERSDGERQQQVRGQRGSAEGSGRVDGAGTVKLQRDGESISVSDNQLTEAAENPDSVYATYTPRKVHIEGAHKHPAKLVESAAMAAVEPPDVTYTPSLPAELATSGKLSDAQLENIVYAGQAHEQTLADGRRKGYFIGDGTGVGKGRQLAGIIMDNFLQGRKKAVWISDSAELINDAKRDWKDLGGDPDDIIPMKGTKLLKTGIQQDGGILFGAYSTLAQGTNKEARFKMLHDWLGEDFDGVIVFDEAHNMGNSVSMKNGRGRTKPAKTALAGIELQQAFPNARVVYASATGATSIRNYGYLERLGLWGKGTAFASLNDFIEKISNGGLAAMELVARDMKAMGVYMARSISYDDVAYDTLQHNLNPMQTEIYNTMSRAWQKVLQNVNDALEVTGAVKNGQARGAALGKIYSGQQRFYNQILTSMAMPTVIADIRKELDAGRSVVLQLTDTNEAQQGRAIEKNAVEGGNLDDLDLTPSETLVQLLEKSFPVQLFEEYTDEKGNQRSRPVLDKDGNNVIDKKAVRMRDALIEEMRQMKLPDSALDMLIDAFGVDQVAEVTGRSRRVVEKIGDDGQKHRVIERRNSATAGTADAKAFQDGKKRILVFSKAGGTGFSYHADLRAKNQQQRVHYLIQPGWEATKAVQGLGRTHRSNQVSAPIVKLITTNVIGQKRFTSTIARRLDQLGALTKGQRQTGSGVFSEKDNLENPISADALATYYKSVDRNVLKKLGLYDSLVDEYGQINDSAEDLRNVSKFLNRILSLEVEEQNEVFQGFYDTFERMMDAAIANGTVDMGLENYRADKIEVKDEKVIRKDPSGADTKYVQMTAYRKPELVSLAEVKKAGQNFKGLVRLEDGSVRAVFEISSKTNPRTGGVQKRFKLESPVKGKSSVYVEETMKAKATAIDKADWARAWKEETAKAPEYTESTLHLLTGTLLPIWNRLPENNTRVMRVISNDGRQYLGRVIRADQIDSVLKGLGANRTMQTYTPQQINEAVLTQGKEVLLRDNKWKITRRRVSGEWRMEVSGQNVWYLPRQYSGIITERINYENRYFIPTGERGNNILADLMKDNPVVDVRERAQSGVEQMIGARTADYSSEWTAKRVGDAKKTPKRLSEIIEQIRHDFGLNITTGHIRGSDIRGQYNRRNQGIRSRIANDLPTVSHELGHHFDQTFDLQGNMTGDMRQELLNKLDPDLAKRYKKDKLLGEGIAEYVRKFLQNREVAAIDYPLFHDYFMGQFTGKDLALIEQLADEVNAYYSLDADTATSSIRLREEGGPDARTFSEKIKAKASVLYQAWVDSNQGVKRFDRATGSSTYKLASNAAYSDAMAGQIIVGDLTDANGQYVAPGLKAALQGLNLGDKTEYRLFGEYLTVKHGPERLAEGMRIFADDRKNSTQWMNARQAQLEAQYPQFKEISERLYRFQKDFLKTWGVDTGLVSQDSADEWAERWAYYVPFNRAVSEDKRGGGAKRGFANQNSTIKKARGSGLDIVHPVDNIVNNIVKMVNAGVRNNVMRQITDAAQTMDADAVFIEKVPAPMTRTGFDMTGVKQQLTGWLEESSLTEDDKSQAAGIVSSLDDILYQYGRGKAHGDVVTVLKGGKPEFWKINDPQLLTSITNMSQPQMHGILDAYGRISRFMTSNITGSNVVWSIFSNAPRDAMTFFAYSKNKNVLKMAAGVGSAYVNKAKGDGASPLYKEYLAMGGGNGSMYSADRDLAKKARKSLEGKKISLNPLDWISFVSDTVESGPRFATYKLMRQAGMNPQEAFYEATDITVNFRRGGTMARQLNRLVPFFNANVQGLDKFRRWITAEDAGQNRKKVIIGRTISYLAVSIALAALVYGINSGDDDREKEYEQLSSFTKNSYWNLPIGDGKFFAIPKPREIAVLSSFFERCMEFGIGENKHAFDEFYVYATDNFFPAMASDLLQAPINGAEETMSSILGNFGLIGAFGYVSANRDFLGRPIVSSGLQNLEPKDQYTERTSKLAYWIGQAFNESPAMIDYFFEQVLGGWWKYQKALFPVGEDKRDLSLGVRNTYVKDSQYSTDLTNWMYDKADASSKAKNSDPTNMDKAIEAKMDANMTSFYGAYYKLAKNKTETNQTRMTRQLVLDMIREYQKTVDNGATTKMQEAVNEVCKSMNSTDYLPSVMPVNVKDGNDVKHTLSDTQYVEYQTDYLRIYWETIENTLNTSASAGDQAYVIKSAKRVAKEQATARVLARIGAPKTKFTEQYGDMTNEELANWFAMMDKAGEDGETTPAEKAAAINSIGSLDDSDIANLWDTKQAREMYAEGVDMRAYVDYVGSGGRVTTEKLIGAKDFGMTEEEYFNFLEALKEVDQPTESGKTGTYTQAEATAAIASIPGLTRIERAYLWQSVNKGWKTKNNPFL